MQVRFLSSAGNKEFQDFVEGLGALFFVSITSMVKVQSIPKRRDGFNAMIQDALDGKIDMILTKSVSRFARNTVASLTTIRKLKEKNVAMVFEKEGINTLDGTREILITILSSPAQEESRNISENTRWGVVRKFESKRQIRACI